MLLHFQTNVLWILKSSGFLGQAWNMDLRSGRQQFCTLKYSVWSGSSHAAMRPVCHMLILFPAFVCFIWLKLWCVYFVGATYFGPLTGLFDCNKFVSARALSVINCIIFAAICSSSFSRCRHKYSVICATMCVTVLVLSNDHLSYHVFASRLCTWLGYGWNCWI